MGLLRETDRLPAQRMSVVAIHRRLETFSDKGFRAFKERIRQLRRDWNTKLSYLCGCSTEFNWAEFRPLRLSREEDWSDWLAWLLRTSETGLFAECLFHDHTGWTAIHLMKPQVAREIPTDDGVRRADIVISCQGQCRINIEVKLWDRNFDKTFETFQKLGAEPNESCYGLILIPSSSNDAWQEVAHAHTERKIGVLFWNDVAKGLRRCLWEAKEPMVWQVWAWTFCCAVESLILGLRAPNELNGGVPQLKLISRWVDLLTSDKGQTP